MSASDIECQAVHWLMRSEEPDWDEAAAADFQLWLDASYANKAAYWRLEHGWRAADRIGALGSESLGGLSVQRDQAEYVYPVDQSYGSAFSKNFIGFSAVRLRENFRMAVGVGAAAIAATLLAALVLPDAARWRVPYHNITINTLAASTPPATAQAVATMVGRRKRVRLPDGSEMELNTDTRIKTRLDAAAREVWIEKGEVYFDIRHAGGRPFVVHSGSRHITVLGTKFVVLRNGDEVKVSVVEGRVRVADLKPQAPIAISVISAGDTIFGREGNTLVAKNDSARVERDLAWREGYLVFEQTALRDVAYDFNRYNGRKLYVEDRVASEIRIGGRFKANNVEAFVRLLGDAYGLKVEDNGVEVRISS